MLPAGRTWSFAQSRRLRFNQDMRLLVAVLAVLVSAQASAETIYKYRDKRTGRDVFVNHIERIPPQYRSQATIAVEAAAQPEEPEHDSAPSAEPARRPTRSVIGPQVRGLGSDLRRAMAGRNLWKDGTAIACAVIDARLVAAGARPLSAPEREQLSRLVTLMLILSLVAGLIAFAVWVVIIVGAFRDGHPGWAVLVFLFWPLGLLYLFLHAGKGRAAFKLACAAAMLFPVVVGLAGAWRFHTWFQGVLAARGGRL